MPRPDLPGGLLPERVLSSRPDRLVVRARGAGAATAVVVKATVAGGGWSGRAALRREARLLDGARGDGVVPLLDVVDRGGRTALVLAFLPAGTLSERAPPDADLVARHLTATVARLGSLGLAHGALRADHVALDAGGHPLLVGFGTAHPTADPHADSASLATLLAALRRRG